MFTLEPERSEEKRLALQTLLEQVSGLPESQVHFQPPNGMMMTYPAITYSRGRAETDFADNVKYRSDQSYTVTVISEDPDEPIRDRIAAMAYCSFERWYPADGLNHDVYNLFF